MIRNQFGHRNLHPLDRVELGEKLEPYEKQAAEERSRANLRRDSESPERSESDLSGNEDDSEVEVDEGEERGKTVERVARKAGVGREYYRQYRYLKGGGMGDLIDLIRAKEMSMDRTTASAV